MTMSNSQIRENAFERMMNAAINTMVMYRTTFCITDKYSEKRCKIKA
jgi:hypothetical protein